MLSKNQKTVKRTFDIVLAIILFFFIWWVILLLAIISFIDIKKSGIIALERIGLQGLLFKIYKIRTMKPSIDTQKATITIKSDKRITKIGHFLRRFKLDELPQIVNVILGDMSFVGPRPDVDGYANKLEGYNRIILTIKPGITGPASIHFKNEEDLLENVSNPRNYNDTVIWPKKVEINKAYIENYSLLNDIKYIFQSVI